MPVLTIDNNTTVTTNASMQTPMKTSDKMAVSTPETDLNSDSSSSGSISSSDSFDNEIADLGHQLEKVHMSDHRRLELDGKLTPEPLLVANPGRFVLFPIQNPEVCAVMM